ncbi:MAG: ABC transporter substrate-binding protein [Candidatus Eremiobacteraeota bacterium]|nr:ABC transporter substrate-binding protein [Candidatus Eremiobacteraeota bacterium]
MVDLKPACRALAALALVAALTGCTKISQNTSPAGGGGGTIPGVLRYGELAEPDSLNALLSTQLVVTDVFYLIDSYFFLPDNRDNLTPEAALEVPSAKNGGISPDGKTLTFHLRHNMKWQDGASLNAKDVVFTFHAIMNPNNNIQVRTGYDQIADVAAKDDYTVIVRMKAVFSPIIAYFMSPQGQYPIMPAHLLARYPNVNHLPFNDKPIGSGPFKIAEWVHGDHITLEANPLYWRGPPKLKKIIYRFLPDNNTIVTQLRTHEIDAWFRADPSKYDDVRALPDHVVLKSPENLFGHIDMNTQDPILSDVRVRQALVSMIDRPRIIQDATSDVFILNDSDLAVFSWALDKSVPHFGYDPGRARKLLDQAGWMPGPDGIRRRNGEKLALQFSYISGNVIAAKIAAILQQEAKAVGVAISQKTYPATLFFAARQSGGVLNSGKYQLAYFGWGAGVDPDDSSLYRCNQFPPNGQNSLFWCDPKLDAAEKDALSTYDQEQRKRDYVITQTELTTQVPTIFLFAEQRLDVIPKAFHGFIPSPAESANWNAWQWSMD